MYTSVTFSDFVDAFTAMNRKENFSYDGLRVLFDYFEEYENSTGEEIEFDVIGICCEYSENTLDEINSYYGQEFEDLEEAQEWLECKTMVCGATDDSIVYLQF